VGSHGKRARYRRLPRRGLLRLGAALATGTLAVGTLAVLTTAPTALASDDDRPWSGRGAAGHAASGHGASGYGAANYRGASAARADGRATISYITPYWADAERPRAAVPRSGTVRVAFGAYTSTRFDQLTVVLETAGIDKRKVTIAGTSAPCTTKETQVTCVFRNIDRGWHTAQVTLRATASAATGRAGLVALTTSGTGRAVRLPMLGTIDVVAAGNTVTQGFEPRPTYQLGGPHHPGGQPGPGRPDEGRGDRPSIPPTIGVGSTAGGSTGRTSGGGSGGGSDTTDSAPTTTAVSVPTTEAPTTTDAGVVAQPDGDDGAAPGLADLARPRQVTNWPATFAAFGLLLVIVLAGIGVTGNRLGWFEESTAAHRA
jgi:hypothetical protein